MRRYAVLSVLVVLMMIVAACGGAATEPTEAPAEPTEAPAEPTATTEEMDGGEGDGGEMSNLGTEDSPLVMSFVPSGDTQEIITGGEEIAEMMEERTDLVIDSNVATSYAAVVEAMGAGNAHIGWLNTFGYLLAHEQYDVEPILATVRFGSSSYRGQIIVNNESDIESLEDLAGMTMCWVDPLSTSGYIIPRVTLRANGINPDEDFENTVEAGSHDNVVIAVYNGECDAGATFVDARTNVEDEYPDVMDQVSVLAESPPIPNDNVSVIPELPDEMQTQIQEALLDIASTEEGQEALNTVYSIEGLEETDDSFYDAFRAQLDAGGVSIEELAPEE